MDCVVCTIMHYNSSDVHCINSSLPQLLYKQFFSFLLFSSIPLSLGSIGISDSTYYGSGVGLIYLDDVTCDGNENYLFECTHRGVGRSNCYHHQDAAVICRNTCKR